MSIILLGQYAASITAILVLVGIIIKWGVLKPMQIYIDKATYLIHPNANGGKSLPDAVAGITRIESKIEKIESRLTRLEEDHQPIL